MTRTLLVLLTVGCTAGYSTSGTDSVSYLAVVAPDASGISYATSVGPRILTGMDAVEMAGVDGPGERSGRTRRSCSAT